ncbi:MAG: family 1 glycosylhydrolase [Gemmatimonadota bacterium]|nr:family 1 glycosylhydrolase [Gemmatimonadota bacterium]
MTFLLATGIDSSCPTLADGSRVDELDRSGHYARWEEDFELVRELGLTALHYGPAYYRTHTGPVRYDWESCDEPMERLRTMPYQLIANLCHFGVPSWLGGFQDPAFPVLFAEYARAFARRYHWVRYYTPVNRINVAASFSALRGSWNECLASEGAFFRAIRNLCMAHEMAVDAILSERPDAVIIQTEAIESFQPAGQRAGREAERLSALAHLPLDLTLGHELAPGMARRLNEQGVPSNDLTFFRETRAVGQRWIGLDYSPAREQTVVFTGRSTSTSSPRGFCALAAELWNRYRVPLFHSETTDARGDAVAWLDQQWGDVQQLRATGIPLHGFTGSLLTDRVGWQPRSGRRANSSSASAGLCDLNRELRPLAERYRSIAQQCAAPSSSLLRRARRHSF